MSLLTVTGYASLDYPVSLDGGVQGDATTLIRHRDTAAWPRPGGCPTYIAMAAARAGQRAAPVMWLGQGHEGRVMLAALADAGVLTDGVALTDAPRSPAALMIYQPDGSCACLFDPGLRGQETLTPAQRNLIAQATHLCISVGPPQVLAAILDLCPATARLYWAVKNDADAFPPDLAVALARRANVIFHSASEREVVGETAAALVETRGGEGVHVTAPGVRTVLPVTRIAATDTTGAGDTFAGTFIAAEMAGETDLCAAARAGIAGAAALLTKRKDNIR